MTDNLDDKIFGYDEKEVEETINSVPIPSVLVDALRYVGSRVNYYAVRLSHIFSNPLCR